MGYTEEVARFIVKTDYEQIPPEAVSNARKAILDCLGVMLAGADQPAGEKVTEYIKELGGAPQSSVVTKGFKTSAPLAALANGTMGHALDYDDYTTNYGLGHPTVVILPALLALSEKNKLPGKKLLEAYIVALEAGTKIARALQPNMRHLMDGWHMTATGGTVAASIACGKLLSLDVTQTRRVIGIGATTASGLRQHFGTMTKPFHAGNAASKGVAAALLAQKDLTADENILESPIGFCKIFSRDCDLTLLTKDLGNPQDMITPDLSIKKYPCCAASHWHLDAIFNIIREHGVKASDVAEVICETGLAMIPEHLSYHRPKTSLEAKFSLEYAMAVALLDRKAGLPQFTEERVMKNDVQQLLLNVEYRFPGEGLAVTGKEKIPNTVIVRMKDGREYSNTVRLVKGVPRNPLSWDEVVEKFQDCARDHLAEKHIGQCIELVSRLEKLEDITPLMNLLRG